MDIKVIKADGTGSRLISAITESAKYESASPAAASFFDSILDTLCFNDPIRVENRRGHPPPSRLFCPCSSSAPRLTQNSSPNGGSCIRWRDAICEYVFTFLSAECCRTRPRNSLQQLGRESSSPIPPASSLYRWSPLYIRSPVRSLTPFG